MKRGKYIVLEGAEGVGKTTQLKILAKYLQSTGIAVRLLREPDSQSDLTARTIRHLTQSPQYPMNTRTEVLLYNAARAQSLQVIKESIEQGVTCLVDRSYLTTLAVQYYGRGDVPEYDTINNIISFAVGDMEPDLTVILDAPVDYLIKRAKSRGQGERFDNLDENFLDKVRAGYLLEAKNRNLPVVSAIGEPLEVFKQVWEHVAKSLATRTKSTTASVPSEPVDNTELVHKDANGQYTITSSGKSELAKYVTDSEGEVYAFTQELSPLTIAAAMARLSRRVDDMRITLLDEFSGQAGKDEKLLQRVITAYGDDSVQQLVGMHLVVEGASNLLTKKLEWGRLAAYLEQSTRYIYFDQKDAEGNYRYFTPKDLDSETKAKYTEAMDQIFDRYSMMVRELSDYIRRNSKVPKAEQDTAWLGATRAQACDAIRGVLPVATKSTVGIFASGQALESLIMHLLSDELPEARDTGQKILDESRKVMPAFLERADKPERGGAMIAYRSNTYKAMESIAKKNLQDSYGQYEEPVRLANVWPRNELDLLPDMLYEHSSLSLEEIRRVVDGWSYDKREKVFKSYIGERLNRRHKPGRAIEKAHYSWDLVCDYGIFRDLQRHRMVDDLQWQALTPRYGYDVPELVEEAGLSDQYEECFDISVRLHSEMQSAKFELESQYATLFGHRMRWKITYNARQAFHFHELRTTPQGHPGYRKLVKQMHDKLCEVHPLIGEAMKFVNTDEDPELTRLAAERYTQFKLSQM